MEILLDVQSCAFEVSVNTSVAFLPDSERGMLASQQLGKGSTVGRFFGSLVYESLSSNGSSFRRYYKKLMRDTILKRANRLPETGMDGNMVLQSVRIIPTPFCAIRYLNYEMY